MSVYLSGNPVPWLVSGCGPEIRYLCLRDILRGACGDAAVIEEYKTLRSSDVCRRFLGTARGGILGDTKRFDLFGSGAMWRFAEAVARGYDRREPAVDATAEFIIRSCRGDSGGFIMNWKPRLEAACVTGAMVRRLLEAGFDDERTEQGVAWIRSHQRKDGGWLHCPVAGAMDVLRLLLFRRAGNGLIRDGDSSVASCVFASFECLMALLEYGQRRGGLEPTAASGAEFLLNNRLFMSNSNPSTPVCAAGGRGADFSLTGYPILLQYDILCGLIAVARAGRFGDGRANGAFNALIAKQNVDGSFPSERLERGMLCERRSTARHGRRDPWVTLNALRFFTRAGLVSANDLV
ncbi:MAG: hypothetical protein MUC76_07835 [Spirochaetes bacterium]|jgi:hypothetical protein|nr:hypothetical protein [Spirochaetota bacterium]